MLNIIASKSTNFDIDKVKNGDLITFLNPVSYLKARKSTQIYRQFDYLLADGWLFAVFLRLIGIHTNRFSFDMTSMAPLAFNLAIAQEQSIFFLGAKQHEIYDFIKTIKKNFPGLNIVGYRDGYFNDSQERNNTILHILRTSPDIVVAGLGVPLQEKFLVDLQKAGWNGCGYTCGGFIHQTSQRLNYYPSWVNKYHLRMPYRFYKEPHFRKRIPDYFKFLFFFFYDYFKFIQKK